MQISANKGLNGVLSFFVSKSISNTIDIVGLYIQLLDVCFKLYIHL